MFSFFRNHLLSTTPNRRLVYDTVCRQLDVPAEAIESLLIEAGHVLVTVQVEPDMAPQIQTAVIETEQAVMRLPGVKSARVILTAERAASSAPPQMSHTAIKMDGIDKVNRPLAPAVKHIIAVASGKGGVGKSTVAVNLAVALAQQGLQVGLLDADIYGPSVPTMFGIADQKPVQEDTYLLPLEAHGVKVMSMGSLVGGDAPMIWRGPMVQSAIQQLLRDVKWGALDILVLDMPPGTGDAQLTVAQKVPLKGAVIVSTPQDIAWLDAAKGIAMFRKVGVPIFGVIENMSQFYCPHCGTVTPLFGPQHTAERAAKLDTAYLGDIPLDPDLQQSADRGQPLALATHHPVGQAFARLAQQIHHKLQETV